MYPVIDIPLPDCYRVNPQPPKVLRGTPASDAELTEWAALMK
jgi:hypothetical protein